MRRLPTPSSAPAPRPRARRPRSCGPSPGRTHPVLVRSGPGHDHPRADREGRQHRRSASSSTAAGVVTLSGGGERRILYKNTCDRAQVWTTSTATTRRAPGSSCAQMTFADGNATGETTTAGAAARSSCAAAGSRSSTRSSLDNRCDQTGPDLGGGAVRVLDQHAAAPSTYVGCTLHRRPVQQRLGVEQHRRLVGGRRLDVHRQQGRRPRSQPRAAPGRRAAARAAPSTSTATTPRCWSPAPRSPATAPVRAAVRSSSSATTAAAPDHPRLAAEGQPQRRLRDAPGIFFLGASRTITDSVVRGGHRASPGAKRSAYSGCLSM